MERLFAREEGDFHARVEGKSCPWIFSLNHRKTGDEWIGVNRNP
ncbi:hypothetical protein BRO54_3652 [Geobacillus proteiniphilus]|uniref:Uncharacterized protein n=1 Tax=Geobacillus proteiniphilus TaxID=860353 RepID=A0A1Q5SKJ8_9BACL|nr:hypothetical protein BRO54_3652 [Geobacillus proteiniphilus]